MHAQGGRARCSSPPCRKRRGAGCSGKLHSYNGCYVPRHMGWTPGRPLSVHSWGAAIDFDASTNGYGVPLERMRIDRDFVRCMEECGWTWGGRWTGFYADGMHFQWSDPLPGTAVMPWQDAMARPRAAQAGPAAAHCPPRHAGRSTAADGPRVIGTPPPPSPCRQTAASGCARRLPLSVLGRSHRRERDRQQQEGHAQDQAGIWTPFRGRAVYRGLLLDAQSAQL